MCVCWLMFMGETSIPHSRCTCTSTQQCCVGHTLTRTPILRAQRFCLGHMSIDPGSFFLPLPLSLPLRLLPPPPHEAACSAPVLPRTPISCCAFHGRCWWAVRKWDTAVVAVCPMRALHASILPTDLVRTAPRKRRRFLLKFQCPGCRRAQLFVLLKLQPPSPSLSRRHARCTNCWLHTATRELGPRPGFPRCCTCEERAAARAVMPTRMPMLMLKKKKRSPAAFSPLSRDHPGLSKTAAQQEAS